MAVTSVTIWHNPRCSKSRLALQQLHDSGAEVTVRRYLNDPPDLSELTDVQTLLGLPARDMIRAKEAEFKEQGLSLDAPDEVLLQAMAATPKLIERPVLIAKDKAVIGRRPDAVKQIV